MNIINMSNIQHTLCVKKNCHFYFYCNFGKCWSIFKILSNVGIRKKWLITGMKNFPLLLNFVAALPCKTNTSVNVNLYNNAVLLSDAKFKQNMTKKLTKVDKITTINKFKDYVRSVLPSHEHKL